MSYLHCEGMNLYLAFLRSIADILFEAIERLAFTFTSVKPLFSTIPLGGSFLKYPQILPSLQPFE
jgi:hypothetical protein